MQQIQSHKCKKSNKSQCSYFARNQTMICKNHKCKKESKEQHKINWLINEATQTE